MSSAVSRSASTERATPPARSWRCSRACETHRSPGVACSARTTTCCCSCAPSRTTRRSSRSPSDSWRRSVRGSQRTRRRPAIPMAPRSWTAASSPRRSATSSRTGSSPRWHASYPGRLEIDWDEYDESETADLAPVLAAVASWHENDAIEADDFDLKAWLRPQQGTGRCHLARCASPAPLDVGPLPGAAANAVRERQRSGALDAGRVRGLAHRPPRAV